MRKKVVGALLTGMLILSACTFSNTKEIDQSLQRSSSGFDTDNTNETAPEMVTTETHEEEQGFVFESREEIMKMIENFASDKGYDIKLDELDAQRVEWVKV